MSGNNPTALYLGTHQLVHSRAIENVRNHANSHAQVTHVVNPNGDVIITLYNPSRVVAKPDVPVGDGEVTGDTQSEIPAPGDTGAEVNQPSD